MKWFIASDIHGSAYYCRQMLERYIAEKADRLLLLGDILYHGPRNDLPDGYAPKDMIVLLNGIKEKVICVRGNCDTEVDQMIYATHGHIHNEEHLPPLQNGDVLLNGHTHVPKCTEHKNFVYMNPGSVSIPKENSYRGYMTLENGIFSWKDLSGKLKNQYILGK